MTATLIFVKVEKILETQRLSDLLAQLIFWDTYCIDAQGSIDNESLDLYLSLCCWDSKCDR